MSETLETGAEMSRMKRLLEEVMEAAGLFDEDVEEGPESLLAYAFLADAGVSDGWKLVTA